MIIKLPMILKPLGPSFWLLLFFLSNNHRKLWKLWTPINFSTAKSGFFYKKKISKTIKTISAWKYHPPRKKRNRVVWTCDCFCLFSKSYNIIYHILCIECKNRFRKDILTNVNNFIIDLLK